MKENQSFIKSKNSGLKQALKNVFNVKLLPKDSETGFKLLKGINRDPSPGHVSKMSNSIKKFGIIRPVVVSKLNLPELIGTYILDGTHLYYACLRNNMDVPYVEISISSEEELIECLAMLNNSSKPWKLTDYVQSWSYIRPDYKRLMSYHNVYDLEFCSIAGILHNSFDVFGSLRVIKDGSFKIKNEDQAVEMLDMVSDLVSLFPKYDRHQYKNLVNGFIHFVRSNYNDYDHKEFMTQIKDEISSLHIAASSTQSAAEFFSNLYTL
jgi:hypothetical protein